MAQYRSRSVKREVRYTKNESDIVDQARKIIGLSYQEFSLRAILAEAHRLLNKD